MPSVYIETTIPSFYYDRRTAPTMTAMRKTTRQWWDQHRHQYRLFTSTFVHEELSRPPQAKRREALRLIEEVEVLNVPPALPDVARYYVEHRLMPEEVGGDAFHLAMASLHSMDFLLTLNCQHLANANKIKHIGVLNGRLGLHVPIVTTPFTLIPELP